ncbi:g5057 [Coccomyxa elongata]
MSMPPPARKSVPPPAPRFDAPKVNPREPTASGSSATPIASPLSQAAAANGTDQHFRPPPPKFQSREAAPGIAVKTANGQASDTSAAPAPRSSVEEKARSAALAAARAAAAHVTPAQREKAIAEAASAVYAATRESESAAKEGEAGRAPQEFAEPSGPAQAGPPKEAPTYEPPEWSGIPQGLDYSLEVMKSGQIIEKRGVADKAFYTFGRSPGCDFLLEHPSASRLHGVLQYRQSDGHAFLYDAGSAHGTFLNKRQLKPKSHAALRVGDMFKFGRSTRMYILGGPDELRPEQGLTREQRRTAAALEAKEARKIREQQIAKAQMDAARSGGVSWGFGEDAVVDEEGEGGDAVVDWRIYMQSHSLTEKQQKIADKIRKREARITNLQRELDKIKAKQTAMEELTAGQAAVLVRNEQDIDRTTEELEDLEETLNESIADSLRGAKQKAGGADPPKKKKKRKNRDAEDEEAELASSSEDEFYDRTEEGRRKKRGREGNAALDAASLYGKKEALLSEKRKLEEAIAKELKGKAAVASPAATAASERQLPAASGSSGAAAGAEEAGQEDGVDALDAFMSNVETQIEQDKVGVLRREVEQIDKQVSEAERLLRLADPDGYYREGTRAAEAAKAKGIKAMEVEKKRREAEERQRRERLAAKAQEAAFVPEVEEDEDMPQAAEPAPAQATNGTPAQREQRAATPSLAQPADVALAAGPAAEHALEPNQAMAQPSPKEDVSSLHRLAPEAPDSGSFGLQVRKRPEGLLSREELRAQAAAAAAKQRSGAAAGEKPQPRGGLLADLALLQRGAMSLADAEELPEGAAVEADGAGSGEEPVWQPPQGQRGDGRTELNDALGY